MMRRTLAIAAIFALALTTLAAAEEHHEEHHPPPGKPAPHGPPPHPVVVPHGPPPHPPARAFVPPGPHGPPPGPHGGPGTFTYRGHPFNRVHLSPYVYPPGWAYRLWAVGAILPPLFLAREYWYADWAALGVPPPPPGDQWVRYGPDLLLVDVTTGQVIEVVPGVFY